MMSSLLVNKSCFLYMPWIARFEHCGTSACAAIGTLFPATWRWPQNPEAEKPILQFLQANSLQHLRQPLEIGVRLQFLRCPSTNQIDKAVKAAKAVQSIFNSSKSNIDIFLVLM